MHVVHRGYFSILSIPFIGFIEETTTLIYWDASTSLSIPFIGFEEEQAIHPAEVPRVWLSIPFIGFITASSFLTLSMISSFQFHLLDSPYVTSKTFFKPYLLFQFHLLDSFASSFHRSKRLSNCLLSIPFIGFYNYLLKLEKKTGFFQFHLLDSCFF